MKKNLKTILLCMFALMLMASGCKKKDANNNEESNKYNIYYINRTGTSLKTKKYTAKSTDTSALANEIIEQMNTEPSSADLSSAKPENVEIDKIEISNNTIDFYYSNEYSQMKQSEEILYRAAVVKTITQIPDIN